MSRLVLASRSPQRRAILERLGVRFEVRPTGVEEIEVGEPAEAALENALRKARAAQRNPAGGKGPPAAGAGVTAPGEERARGEELVLGVDTMVALDGRIYGKPEDEGAARRTLEALSGETHTVIGGLALLDGARELTAVAQTEVCFRDLGDRLIDWYLATGEWRERAGGYAIQGAGAALVREVRGDYENVVGLPLAALLDLCPELL